MKIKRRGQDEIDLDYNWDGHRVRGTLPLSLLTAIFNALKDGRLTLAGLEGLVSSGGVESNLAPGAAIVDLETLLFSEFLPKRAKPKLKQRAFEADEDQAKRLVRVLGKVPIHEIRPAHATHHRETQLEGGFANNTVRKDLHMLGRVMDYAVERGLVRRNPLLPVKDLPKTDRSMVWLRKSDIVKLLWACCRAAQKLVLFMVLTGARICEALDFKASDIDWKRRIIRLPTEKRRGKTAVMRAHMRTLKIDDLGPRFIGLLKIMKPHPRTGYFFCLREDGKPMDSGYAADLIGLGVDKADLRHLIPKEIAECGGHDHVIPQDLRGTFTNHGAIVGWRTQKIRAYLGQRHSDSIDSYLDEAEIIDPEESVFFDHRNAWREAAAKRKAAASVVEAQAPAPSPAVWPDNGPSQTLIH